MIFDVKLIGQNLVLPTMPVLAAGSANKVFVRVIPDEAWDGLTIKLIFRRVYSIGVESRSVAIGDLDAEYAIPHEVLHEGYLYIGASGVAADGTVKLTTAQMLAPIRIHPSEDDSADASEEITPELADQILALIGPLAELETGDKSSLVAAVNEALKSGRVPVVYGATEDGVAYRSKGDELSEPEVGTQIIFVPSVANTAPAVTLSLNGGAAVSILIRDHSANPKTVLTGDLAAGIPHTLTYNGNCWLLDNAFKASYLLRKFAAVMDEADEGELWGIPVRNPASDNDFTMLTLKGLVGEDEELRVSVYTKAAVDAAIAKVLPFVTTSNVDYVEGDTYEISGDALPEVAAGSGNTHVGKGKQIIFCPSKSNATLAPKLSINGGKAIPIRLRAPNNQGTLDLTPDATLSVPVGMLMRGVPYTLTFCGLYWLVDSMIACSGEVDVSEGYAAALEAETVGSAREYLWTRAAGRYYLYDAGNNTRYHLHAMAGEDADGSVIARLLYVVTDYCNIEFYGGDNVDDWTVVPHVLVEGDTGDIYCRGVLLGSGSGADGKSAYEIAVANGFEGDEQDWLASLQGADGADGSNGSDGVGILSVEQTTASDEAGGENVITVTLTDGSSAAFAVKNGAQGPQGETGETGATGPQGEQGETGAAGANGADGADGVSPTVEVNKADGVTTITITDASGTKTATINDGVDGQDGAQGETGAQGVGIASVTAAENDAGVYVEMALTDGSEASFTVARGQQGPQGEKGETGATGTLQIPPLFAESVEWLEANGDTAKVYILPNNLIYAYLYQEGTETAYTNWLPISTDTDRSSVFNGIGYQDGYRLSSSSGALSAVSGMMASGFIPCSAGDIIRIKGWVHSSTSYTQVIGFYDASNAYLGYTGFAGSATTFPAGVTITTESDGTITVTIDTSAISQASSITDCNAFRVCNGDLSNAIITVNEEITEDSGTEAGYAWGSTGHSFVPTDYEERILALEAKAGSVRSTQEYLNKRNTYIAPVPRGYCESLNAYADTDGKLTELYDLETMTGMFSALAAAHPDYITETTLGKDATGTYDIKSYVLEQKPAISDGYASVMQSDKPVFILTAGLHGMEHDAVHEVYHFMRDLCENHYDSEHLGYLRNNVKFVIVPLSNPWGYVNLSYHNSNDVDLNKNFEHGYRNNGTSNTGTAAYSEAETVLLKGVFDSYPNAVFHLECHGKAAPDNAINTVIWFSLMQSVKSELIELCANGIIHDIGRRLYKLGLNADKSEGGYITYYTLNGRPKDYTATEYGMLSATMEGTGRLAVAGHETYNAEEQRINCEALENFILRVLDALDSAVQV